MARLQRRYQGTSVPRSGPSQARATRVTAVRDVITAQALGAACVGSGMVALHFATAQGIVVVRCPVDSFCAAARAPRDHHGNPWPAFNGSTRDSLPKSGPERLTRRPGRFHPALADLPVGGCLPHCRKLSPETVTALRVAWERCQEDSSIRVAHVVRQLGISRSTVDAYFHRFSPAQAPQPVLKPSGRIL